MVTPDPRDPCGCWDDWEGIHYCPTHAAAFENAKRVVTLRQAMLDGQRAASDAEGKVAALLAALERYGVHERGCAMLDHPFDHKDCTCGLSAAIAQATEEGG